VSRPSRGNPRARRGGGGVSANERPSTVVVVQTVVPDYRERFIALLQETLGARLRLYAGDADFAVSIETSAAIERLRVRNRFLFGRRLLWQTGTVRVAVGADVAVLVLNPRILSAWAALLLRRLRGRRTLLWGHAWPRQGRASRSDAVRGLMRKLGDTLVVYTEAQARELRERMPEADVVAAPNALYLQAEIAPAVPSAAPRDFVCVGRLVPAKKADLLLAAFALAVEQLPTDVRLVFVGDGPLRGSLETRAATLRMGDRVVFEGHRGTIAELRPLYGDAIASVSPGYVGLSLIQSIGFGVPMLVARDEPHSPEIAAAIEGENVRYFASDSPSELASLLVSVAEERAAWLARREQISRWTRANYSVEVMVAAIVSALRLPDVGPAVAPGQHDEAEPPAKLAP
jgi:glycosyltransferase involved in cell wall biosynthesis